MVVVYFAENMSNRSGHVDVNERRLRPIYGQNSLAVQLIRNLYLFMPMPARVMHFHSTMACAYGSV